MTTSILDIPDVILERILFSLAYGEDRGDRYQHPPCLPLQVIPLSSTCRKFRRLASNLLTDDTQWRAYAARSRSLMSIPFFNHKNDLTDVCSHLSNDVDKPLSYADPEICQKRPCGFVHRQLAWYRLAAPSIKSFDLFTVSQKLPVREAFRIFNYFKDNHAPIEEFNMKYSWIHTVISVERLVSSLDHVLSFTAHNLKTLQITMFDNPEIGKVLAKTPLPSLKTLRLYSPVDEEACDMDLICTHLSQLLQSGTKLETLELHGEAVYVENLPRILSVCPYVHDIEFFNVDGFDYSFPSHERLSQFKISKLTMECRISQENLKNIAELVMFSRHICEVHFSECEIPSLGSVLEMYKLDFGSRIKTLVLHSRPGEAHNEGTIAKIAAYCPNIEKFNISVTNGEVFSPLGDFLMRSEYLKHFTVRTQKIRGMEENGFVTELVEKARYANCPIETIEFDLVLPTADEICQLMGSFANSLRFFRLRRFFPLCQDEYPFASVEDTVQVLRYLEKGYGFPNLKSISLPVPNTNHLDDDEKLLLDEMKCLLHKMETKIKCFDACKMIGKLSELGP